jgi:NAD-dependent dihydropyrimidine dehydrogenase PreA subunit
MTHVITALCLRDGACVDVCPVECIVNGKPEDEWPWFFIDPNTCIDCGACVPECPFEAIFPLDEIPTAYELKAGQEVQPFRGARYAAAGGETIDLTIAQGEGAEGYLAADANMHFYAEGVGPGYAARNM